MKKILCIIGLFLLPTIVIGSPLYNASEEYYVNGISSNEDIGGVEAYTERNPDPYGNPYLRRVYFKNHRDCTVQVYYEFIYGHPDSDKPNLLCEGTLILEPKETKCLDRMKNSARNIKIIVRRL